MSDDRNLLFGVMAVQLKFVTPQDLMLAAAAWAVNRDATLKEHLLEKGLITDRVCNMIEGLLEEQVAAHDGNVHKTLQSFGGDRAVHESFAASSVIFEKGALDSFGGGEPATVAIRKEPEAFPEIGCVSSSGSPVNADGGANGEPLEDVDALTFEHPGRYTIKGEHSKGGIGRILVAYDSHVGREIAMKELLPDGSIGTPSFESGSRKTTALLRRFLREARVTGQLEHPAIIPVYEVGKRPDGSIYYTMKLVRGRTLQTAIKEAGRLEERLKLLTHFHDLCNAIRYAHSRCVIHRDIKPQNVMVGEFGETVVLDWGLAKVKGKRDDRARSIERDLQLIREAGAMETVKGTPMGTPAYMSPEQAEGKLEAVDERSDVWSLGAVLYEILTGEIPFQGVNAYEIMGHVLKDDPRPVRSVDPLAPDEMAAVAMKCLRKEPEERYQSAEELALDVENYLTGRLVSAYDYSRVALAKRWIKKRWPIVLTASAAILALLITFGWSYVNIRAEKDRVVEQRNAALRNIAEAYFAYGHWAAAEARWPTAEVYLAKSLLMDDRDETRYALNYAHTMPRVQARLKFLMAGHEGSVINIEISPYGEYLASAGLDGTARLWNMETGSELAVFKNHTDKVFNVAFSSDGKYFASAGADGQVCVYETGNARFVKCMPGTGKRLFRLAWSPTRDLLAAVGDDPVAVVWDTATWSRKYELIGHDAKIWGIGFNPAGDIIATWSRDWTARTWDSRTGKPLSRFVGHRNSVSSAEFLPGGRLMSTSWDKTLRVWDLQTGEQIFAHDHPGAPIRVFLFPDKRRALIGYEEGMVRLIDTDEDEEIRSWKSAHSGQLLHLAGLGTSGGFITSGGDGFVRLWDVDEEEPAETLQGTEGFSIERVASGPYGDSIAAAGRDGIIRVWSLRDKGGVRRVKALDSDLLDMALDGEGKVAAVSGDKGSVSIIDAAGAERVAVLVADTSGAAVNAVSLSGDGRFMVTGSDSGRIGFFDLSGLWREESLEPMRSILAHGDTGGPVPVRAAAVGGDGKIAASVGDDGRVIVWDVNSGEMLHRFYCEIDNVRRVMEISPDGKLLAVGGKDADVRIWDLESGALKFTLKGHSIGVRPVKFSPAGKLLASGGKDGDVKIWDMAAGKLLATLKGHGHWVRMIEFSNDGKFIVSASIIDKKVIIWDTWKWKPRHEEILTDRPQSIAIRPDSGLVAIGSRDRKIWLWEPNSGKFLHVMEGHQGSVDRMAFFKHGKTYDLLSMDSKGKVFIWPFKDEILKGDSRKIFEKTQQNTGLTVRGMELAPWSP